MTPIYNDTYTGPRYTYGLQYRPADVAHIPAGWILWSEARHPEFRHGTVAYPRPLTDDEIRAFELTLVDR